MSTPFASPRYGAAVLRHLPLLREMIGRLGIRDVVHRELPPDPRNRVVDADCVVLMIENILHGRVALYGMNDWLEATDIDVILGEGCPADAFTDDRLAKTLDHIYAYGVDDLLSAVVRGYLQENPGPSAYSVHTDTTTAKLWGDYERSSRLPPARRRVSSPRARASPSPWVPEESSSTTDHHRLRNKLPTWRTTELRLAPAGAGMSRPGGVLPLLDTLLDDQHTWLAGYLYTRVPALTPRGRFVLLIPSGTPRQVSTRCTPPTPRPTCSQPRTSARSTGSAGKSRPFSNCASLAAR